MHDVHSCHELGCCRPNPKDCKESSLHMGGGAPETCGGITEHLGGAMLTSPGAAAGVESPILHTRLTCTSAPTTLPVRPEGEGTQRFSCAEKQQQRFLN
ncbi:hypothetical protein CB1_000832001 [Camelus ferus]|nr:hypothetical protein CB1_000832001 [Camelus ferus]